MSEKRSYHRRTSSPFISDISEIIQEDQRPVEEERFSGRADSELLSFLSKLGLSSYIDVFEENQISASDLPHLTKEDLIDMNIPIGPRNRILRSIQTKPQNTREVLRKEIEDFMREVDELTANSSRKHIGSFTEAVLKLSEQQNALMNSIQENTEKIRELSNDFSTPSPQKHPRKCMKSPLHNF